MNSFSAGQPGRIVFKLILLFFLLPIIVTGQSYNDVAVQQSVSSSAIPGDENIIFTIQIINEGKTDLSNLSIKSNLEEGVIYIEHESPLNTSFDPNTGIWNIGETMDASVEMLELKIETSMQTEGVRYNFVQVWIMNEIDVDSEPGNDFLLEDDHANACFSKPYEINISQGESVTLEAPGGYQGYAWYRNSGNGPELLTEESIYMASLPGEYSFTVDFGSSLGGNCCPIFIKELVIDEEPPIALADWDTTYFNTPTIVDILINDTDPNGNLDTNTVAINDPPNNGDGVNDTFKIDGLRNYDSHKLMVFNRWGNKVLQTDNYRNDWNGYWDDK